MLPLIFEIDGCGWLGALSDKERTKSWQPNWGMQSSLWLCSSCYLRIGINYTRRKAYGVVYGVKEAADDGDL